MKPLRLLIIIAALAGSAYGQTFEVASIRESVAGRRTSIEPNPGSLTMRNVTLMRCISWAYRVYEFQISGGPQWRDSARYDIVARSAGPASEDQLRLMLRSLLADRFKLALRIETKETLAYVLTIDKNGHKLRPAKGGPRSVQPDPFGLALQNATMFDLEQFLLTVPGMDRPVFNRTGLEGAFDFTLTLFNGLEANEEDQKRAVLTAGAIGFSDALARLGLKLEMQKVPLDSIVIENADKPAEN
jgi:uncharacterized protein (TIGR03435 family)